MTRKAAYSRIALALSFCLWAGGLAAAPPPPKIGDPAPAFTLQTLDGKTVSSESLKGKTVLIDFWATWCGPCRKALPELKELLQKNTGKPLMLISVSADQSRKDLEDFVHANGMNWLQAWDSKGQVIGGVFGVSNLPSYVVINAEGRIAYVMRGWAPMSTSALLSQAVSSALTTACTADKVC